MRVIKIVKYLFLFLIGGNSLAIDYRYSVFSTLGYNDNLTAVMEGTAGYFSNTGITFRVETEDDSKWGLDFSGNYAKEYFSIDELNNQIIKGLSSNLTYEASDSNFSFLLRGDLSQAPQNRRSTQQFNNLTDVKTITARPSYFFKISSVDQIHFDLTYIHSERNDQSTIIPDGYSYDSIGIEKSISLERKINETNGVSLVISSIDNEFDGDRNNDLLGIDYVQDDAFLRWVGRGKSNQVQLEYGIAKIEDEFGNEFDTNLINIIFERQINRNHEIEASYQKGFYIQLSDNYIDDIVEVSDQSFGTAQELNSANLTYTIRETYLNLAFSVFNSEFIGVDNINEEKDKGYSFTTSYSLSRILSTSLGTNVSLTVRKNNHSFFSINDATINTRIDSAELRFNYSYNPSLSYFVAINVRDTASNNTEIYLNGGDSKSVYIGFVYSPRNAIQN